MTIIRRVLLLVVLVAWNASLASAQNTQCDASQFDALTNMWKLEPDQNTREIPAGELAAERKVMQRVVEMFKSAFVPTGAAGYYGVNYDILPQAVTNKSRYGNTYIFSLSNHKIECRSGKPVALDVSLGNVSVQVNMHFVGEAENGDSSVGFSFLPRGYYQLKRQDRAAPGQCRGDPGVQLRRRHDGLVAHPGWRPAVPVRHQARVPEQADRDRAIQIHAQRRTAGVLPATAQRCNG